MTLQSFRPVQLRNLTRSLVWGAVVIVLTLLSLAMPGEARQLANHCRGGAHFVGIRTDGVVVAWGIIPMASAMFRRGPWAQSPWLQGIPTAWF